MRITGKLVVVILFALLLTACGKATQEDVVKDVAKKWSATNYDMTAKMEVKTASNPRVYDIQVWHTQPQYYRVQVKEQGTDAEQMIIRNDEGVFVVTPSTKKTYKFQSEWPKQNSQAYIMGTLAEDLIADKQAKMTQTETHYVFELATRNSEKTGMPMQKLTIDKKTMLPTNVVMYNDVQEEQITITFQSIDTSKKHSKDDYAVDTSSTNNEQQDQVAVDGTFEVFYPNVQFENTLLAQEQIVQDDGTKRSILVFEGDKSYTVVQQPIESQRQVAVFASGDLMDLGFAVGALTENSISWEQNNMSFFVASTKLTQEELIQVASSMIQSGVK